MINAVQCDFCGHWGVAGVDKAEEVCNVCNYGTYVGHDLENEEAMNKFIASKNQLLITYLNDIAVYLSANLSVEEYTRVCILLKNCQMLFGGRDFANLLITLQETKKNPCFTCRKHYTNDATQECKEVYTLCDKFDEYL